MDKKAVISGLLLLLVLIVGTMMLISSDFVQTGDATNDTLITRAPTPFGEYCGDAVCSGAENCSLCSIDCGICPVVTPTPNGLSPIAVPASEPPPE